MITLESGGMLYSKKIAYFINKIPIPRNERKQTGPYGFLKKLSLEIIFVLNYLSFSNDLV
jgi:hypothetical protein